MTAQTGDAVSIRSRWQNQMRKASYRFGRKDWIGDAALAALSGVAVVAGCFLPFANTSTGGDMNWSLTRPAAVNGAFAAGFGMPMLLLGVIVLIVALGMILIGPRRHTPWLGIVLIVLGVAVFAQSNHAAASIRSYHDYSLGLGLFVTALCGMILVPIGLASFMVGRILLWQDREPAAPGGPDVEAKPGETAA